MTGSKEGYKDAQKHVDTLYERLVSVIEEHQPNIKWVELAGNTPPMKQKLLALIEQDNGHGGKDISYDVGHFGEDGWCLEGAFDTNDIKAYAVIDI